MIQDVIDELIGYVKSVLVLSRRQHGKAQILKKRARKALYDFLHFGTVDRADQNHIRRRVRAHENSAQDEYLKPFYRTEVTYDSMLEQFAGMCDNRLQIAGERE